MKLGRIQRVYVIHNQEFGITKIGISDDPYNRMGALSAECGCELTLCFHSDPLDDALRYERLAHNVLASKRKKGEWFNISPEEAIKVVTDIIKDAETDPILAQHRIGTSISKIAKDFNVSRQAIIYRLQMLGVKSKDIREVMTDEILKIDSKYIYPQVPILKKPTRHNVVVLDEKPPKGSSGFKRLEPNLYFNGEWYQISIFKDGKFNYSYTKDIEKAREYITNIEKLA